MYFMYYVLKNNNSGFVNCIASWNHIYITRIELGHKHRTLTHAQLHLQNYKHSHGCNT